MFCHCFGNRQLQFRGHLVGNRWNYYHGRCVYALCDRDRNHYRNINRRSHQVRLCNSNSNGCRAFDNHFGYSGLFPGFHPDHSDIHLHTDGDWHREFQLFCHVVYQPHKHWQREQLWCFHAHICGNGCYYGHLNTGLDQVWISNGERVSISDCHLRFRFVPPCFNSDHGYINVLRYSARYGQLQLWRCLVGNRWHYFSNRCFRTEWLRKCNYQGHLNARQYQVWHSDCFCERSRHVCAWSIAGLTTAVS